MRIECGANLTIEYLAFISNENAKRYEPFNESHMAVIMYGVPVHPWTKRSNRILDGPEMSRLSERQTTRVNSDSPRSAS